jgi:hypothetical protein
MYESPPVADVIRNVTRDFVRSGYEIIQFLHFGTDIPQKRVIDHVIEVTRGSDIEEIFFAADLQRPWQDSVMPIRAARFAIDDHTPNRDLYLSPLHCIFLNEALIPAMYLINETSIAQGAPPDMSEIEYYHIDP